MTDLIVLEGIDCSGKSTIAKLLADKLGYEHEHEPTFTSVEADNLNFKNMDDWQREFMFAIDRYKHQGVLNSYNVVLDRYVLSGLAYANYFGCEARPMVKSIYNMENIFKRPRQIQFLKMDPKICFEINESRKGTEEYNPMLGLSTMYELSQRMEDEAFWLAKKWKETTDIYIVDPVYKDVQGTLDKCLHISKIRRASDEKARTKCKEGTLIN